MAWSYFYDLNGDVTGRLVLFWLDRVVLVVATAMLAELVSERLGIIRQAWPRHWSSALQARTKESSVQLNWARASPAFRRAR